MPANNLTLSSDGLLAEYIDLNSFRGFTQQRLAVGPDMLALLVRDGKIVASDKGANVSVGGFWRGIKDSIVGRHNISMLVASLKPFPLTTTFDAITVDKVKVRGELTIELQINPERPENIMGLMATSGAPGQARTGLAKADVLARIKPHLGDRVLEAGVQLVTATDLRGNTLLQNKVQAGIMTEVERVVADLGLIVRAVALNWAMNEDEMAAVEARDKTRLREAADLDALLLNRAVQRETETTVFKLKADLSAEKVKQASETELKHLVLGDELAFVDARDTGRRMAELKDLQHRLELANTERRSAWQGELQAVQHAAQLERARGEQSQFELARFKIQRDYANVEIEIKAAKDAYELKYAALVRQQQAESIKILGEANNSVDKGKIDVALHGKRGEAEIQAMHAKAQIDGQIALAKAYQGMPPDLVQTLVASTSPQFAAVMIEQVKAGGSQSAEREKMLREMIAMAQKQTVSTEQMALQLAQTAMQSSTGIAQGIGGVVSGIQTAQNTSPVAMMECPSCRVAVKSTARNCPACGFQLRT